MTLHEYEFTAPLRVTAAMAPAAEGAARAYLAEHPDAALAAFASEGNLTITDNGRPSADAPRRACLLAMHVAKAVGIEGCWGFTYAKREPRMGPGCYGGGHAFVPDLTRSRIEIEDAAARLGRAIASEGEPACLPEDLSSSYRSAGRAVREVSFVTVTASDLRDLYGNMEDGSRGFALDELTDEVLSSALLDVDMEDWSAEYEAALDLAMASVDSKIKSARGRWLSKALDAWRPNGQPLAGAPKAPEDEHSGQGSEPAYPHGQVEARARRARERGEE